MIWRLAGAGLLIAAILGPWAYDVINVPAEYLCSAPFVRLEGDFCGVPLSGTWMVSAFALSIRYFPILALALLPLFSTLALMFLPWSDHLRRLQVFAWAGALILGGLWLWSMRSRPDLRLWGGWVYTGLAAAMFLAEAVLARTQRKIHLDPGL